MVRRHPVTGRKSLYISSIYNDAIEAGRGRRAHPDRGALRVRRQPKYMYRHAGAARRADVGQPLHRHAVTPHDPPNVA